MSITKIVVSTVLLASIGGVVWYNCPSVRQHGAEVVETITNWTPEAIASNPVGYANYCEKQLKGNLAQFEERRSSLQRSANELAKTLAEREELYKAGLAMNEEIAALLDANVFPVEFHGATYSKEQLTAQFSLTLAQIDGLKASLDEIREATSQAAESNQKIVLQIDSIKTNLSVLKTRREVFKANQLTETDLQMFDTCKKALLDSESLLTSEYNPVRAIDEILKGSVKTAANSSQERVDQYLADYRKRKNASVQEQNVPADPAGTTDGAANQTQSAPIQIQAQSAQ